MHRAVVAVRRARTGSARQIQRRRLVHEWQRYEFSEPAGAVLDAGQNVLGDGCQQLLSLPKGTFFLVIQSPPDEAPQRFRPVLLGLAGAKTSVPREYLEAFFQQIGENP